MTERPLETGWLDDTPVGDNIMRAFIHNQADANEIVAAAVSGTADRLPGAFLADARSAVPYLNQAILSRPVLDPADPLLNEIGDYFAGSPRVATVLSMWPTPDLSSRGWHLVGHPAFVVRGPGAVPTTTAPGVTVHEVRGAEQLAVAERVAIDGYPVDEARAEPPGSVLPAAMLGRGLDVRIALLDGAPVAVGNAMVAHGVVNLCLGATLPQARRRGAWEALVWARVASAPDLPAIAYTSDYSRPGFVRMGFLPVFRFTMWAIPPG